MVRWAGYGSFQTLVPVDSFVKDFTLWVKNVEDSISIHFLTSREDANLEQGESAFEQLQQEWPLEDSDLYDAVLVFERSVKIWPGIRSV